MKNFTLNDNPKITTGFKVPETYFDGFSNKIMQQLPNEEPKVISFWSSNKRWIYSVAAVIVLSLSIPALNFFSSNSNSVSDVVIENYLANHSTISDDDIVELLDNSDIEALKSNNPKIEKDVLEEELKNNPEIEQYLLN